MKKTPTAASLRKLLGGMGRRPISSKRSTRSLRPSLEGLEQREVITVAFTPALGAETIFWRTNGAGYAASTSLTGPVSNLTALINPQVFLIFSGSSRRLATSRWGWRRGSSWMPTITSSTAR